jgi:hypothetical protein
MVGATADPSSRGQKNQTSSRLISRVMSGANAWLWAVSDLVLFRSILLLPLLLPLCWFGLDLAGVPNILVFSLLPLGFGGVPYIVFAFLASRWMKGKTRRQISIFGLAAPLLFIPFQVVFMLFVYLLRITQITTWFGGVYLRDCFEISYFVLLFGYGYVVLAFFLLACFRWIRESIDNRKWWRVSGSSSKNVV